MESYWACNILDEGLARLILSSSWNLLRGTNDGCQHPWWSPCHSCQATQVSCSSSRPFPPVQEHPADPVELPCRYHEGTTSMFLDEFGCICDGNGNSKKRKETCLGKEKVPSEETLDQMMQRRLRINRENDTNLSDHLIIVYSCLS